MPLLAPDQLEMLEKDLDSGDYALAACYCPRPEASKEYFGEPLPPGHPAYDNETALYNCTGLRLANGCMTVPLPVLFASSADARDNATLSGYGTTDFPIRDLPYPLATRLLDVWQATSRASLLAALQHGLSHLDSDEWQPMSNEENAPEQLAPMPRHGGDAGRVSRVWWYLGCWCLGWGAAGGWGPLFGFNF